MRLQLHLVDRKDAPPAAGLGGIPATAWTNGAGDIFAVAPFHRILFARRRIAHEVEHNLEPDFDTNADHHPWHHFCGRVAHAIRLTDDHLHPRSIHLADLLLLSGAADSDTP